MPCIASVCFSGGYLMSPGYILFKFDLFRTHIVQKCTIFTYLAINTNHMKKLIFSLLIISSISLLAQNPKEAELNEFIDQWHQDAANVDREAYFGKIDTDGIFIGTDASEIWTKQEFYDWAEPQFTSDGKAWDFKASDRNIYFGEKSKYVWFDELLAFSGGTLRGSGVLVKRKKEWKIMHYVLSLPVPNDRFRAVIDVLENKE